MANVVEHIVHDSILQKKSLLYSFFLSSHTVSKDKLCGTEPQRNLNCLSSSKKRNGNPSQLRSESRQYLFISTRGHMLYGQSEFDHKLEEFA